MAGQLTHLKKDFVLHNDAKKDAFKDLYDNWAPDYDKDVKTLEYNLCKPMAETFNAAALKIFARKVKQDIKIIEVAAGTGLVGAELYKLDFTNVDALDFSPKMLHEAKKKNVYKRFFCVPIDDRQISQFNTGEYDALICASALGNNHIMPTALKGICRIVSKGGLICFDIYDQHLEEWQGKLLEFENDGIWETISKEKLPLYGNDQYLSETNVFVFKV